ncbi:uncharacterized protein BJ212DRAFT_1304437 [Suillus subaureus]|uniref:Uncharacterized protein n=1 Tax=Suillus subaureus TaxID=48587 RepID=A0A9P7J5V8_9AGAM|nr:uncharacterized protein BJ212DRAFT_1304437 [Suillus subaureus]KAG1804138.1 hypothetical protein BJ212DRAFT_1304437 [Suillus subaureus]
MPLRLTKDGEKAKTKAGREKVGNTALLDSHQGSGTASLDHNVKEDARLDKSANKAIVGFNPIHAFPLVLPKEWIVEDTMEKDHKKRDELPILCISDKAPKDWKIKAAVKQCLHRLREVLEYYGQWIVTVFDANQVDDLVGIHISRNETKHIYMQSPEEGLIQRYKMLEANNKTSWHIECIPMAKGTYYIYSPEMQLNQFHKVMLSGYGGLIAYATAHLENQLCWCFNTVSDTLAEYQKIEAKSKTSTSFQKLKIKKEEILEDLKWAMPVLNAISDPLCDKLKSFFDTHLGNNTPASYRFGDDQDEMWLTTFKEYSYAVVAAMDEYANEVLSANETKDLDLDVCSALLGSIVKVSSWFSPMLYMTKGHGKDWEPGCEAVVEQQLLATFGLGDSPMGNKGKKKKKVTKGQQNCKEEDD